MEFEESFKPQQKGKNILKMSHSELKECKNATEEELNQKMDKLRTVSKSRNYINPLYSKSIMKIVNDAICVDDFNQKSQIITSTFKYQPSPTAPKLQTADIIRMELDDCEKNDIPKLQLENNHLKEKLEQIKKNKTRK